MHIKSYIGRKFPTFPNHKHRTFQPVKLVEKPEPGLPDGMFSNQKSEFGKILEGLGI
jgi:hypothetical protein